VDADLLVNCTSVGLRNPSNDGATFEQLGLGADSLRRYATVVDLVYRSNEETELVAAARGAGCAVVDGLEILVHQGALSFETWTGRPAPLDAMRIGARGEESSHEPLDESRAPLPAERDSATGGARSG
jgi:shikimate 5-dehydrogenase